MASNKSPGRSIPGIRGSIPSGYLLGRAARGEGDVELLTLKKLQAVGLSPTSLPGPPTGLAGGDLTGSYPDPVVRALRGRNVSNVAPSDKNVLAWDNAGTAWAPLMLGAVAYTSAYADLTGAPAIHNIPNGGATGFVLTKNSAADYDVSWLAGGSGGGSSGAASIQDDGTNLYIALSDTDGQLVLDGSGDPIFALEVLPPAALPVATTAALGAVKPDGTSITITGGGIISAIPVTHAFQVILSSDFSFSEGTSTTVVFNSASIDTDAAYNVGTGIYTPKKAGKWFFQGAFKVDATAGAINFAEILLNKNGSFVNLGLLGAYTAGASQTPGGVSGAILQMNGTTDNVNMNVYVSTTGASGGKVLTGLGACFFGFWIGP